jgi:hypothetical protein
MEIDATEDEEDNQVSSEEDPLLVSESGFSLILSR